MVVVVVMKAFGRGVKVLVKLVVVVMMVFLLVVLVVGKRPHQYQHYTYQNQAYK